MAGQASPVGGGGAMSRKQLFAGPAVFAAVTLVWGLGLVAPGALLSDSGSSQATSVVAGGPKDPDPVGMCRVTRACQDEDYQ